MVRIKVNMRPKVNLMYFPWIHKCNGRYLPEIKHMTQTLCGYSENASQLPL